MKKFLALAMALCLSVTCLAGCTNDKDNDPDASQTPGSSVEQPVDDQQQTETETPDVTDDEQDVSQTPGSSVEQPVDDQQQTETETPDVADDEQADEQDGKSDADVTDDVTEEKTDATVSSGAAD